MFLKFLMSMALIVLFPRATAILKNRVMLMKLLVFVVNHFCQLIWFESYGSGFKVFFMSMVELFFLDVFTVFTFAL